MIFTAFCQEASGEGTIWIDTVEADSADAAKDEARTKCAESWGYDPLCIHVLGIAEGEVKIAFWEDICDASDN